VTCVLVVEDESGVWEVLIDAISHEGYTTVGAATGDEAVTLLEVADLELVVTDINLPGQRDGIDVAVAAWQSHPGIPVLFISGRHWRLTEAEKLGGPAAYLRKPFSLTALIQDVDRLIAVGQSEKLDRLCC
jgi:two-component system NtrC family sensor kinase